MRRQFVCAPDGLLRSAPECLPECDSKYLCRNVSTRLASCSSNSDLKNAKEKTEMAGLRCYSAERFIIEPSLERLGKLQIKFRARQGDIKCFSQADVESLLSSRELSAHSTTPTDPKTTTIATIMTGGMASRPSSAPSSTATMGMIRLIVERRYGCIR